MSNVLVMWRAFIIFTRCSSEHTWQCLLIGHSSPCCYIIIDTSSSWGTRWRNFWGTALKARRSPIRYPIVSLEFFFDIIFPAAILSGIDSASNINEDQEYFLEGKGGRCLGLTNLPPSYANFLELWEPRPPGTLRTCPDLYRDCFTFYE
jgi:hypothetical protein